MPTPWIRYDQQGNVVSSGEGPDDPRTIAATKLQQMAATDVPSFTSQIQADVQTITSSGWAALTAQQQHDIMLRVVNGFGTVLTAIQTHAEATGVLPS